MATCIFFIFKKNAKELLRLTVANIEISLKKL